jgi:NAD(P)-dependent dehydrogenase (short-subunit alcohol dehydrogenase family)
MVIRDSVALVTGANRGLGLAFAQALLARGARKVYAAARDPSSVKLAGVVPIRLDITRPEAIAAIASVAHDVTLLVNNAGILRAESKTPEEAIANARAEIETNYLGTLAMSRAFAPILAKNGGGAILDVLSVLSWVVLPHAATYCASKAAAWAATNALRLELRPQGTQVVGLHVGYMDTDMTQGQDVPKARPEDIVGRALDALEAGEEEVLADEASKRVKEELSSGVYLRDWPAEEDQDRVLRRSDVVPSAQQHAAAVRAGRSR